MKQSQSSDSTDIPADLSRYIRQMRYTRFGETGQRNLGAASVLIVGCGALGSNLANTMVRAGVGNVRIVDRDFLEMNNLQRQVLFDEDDVKSGLPKAIVAAEKLKRINSNVNVDAVVADVDHKNITALCDGVGLILDGTDNFETRFLINDAAIAFGIPWVYGGCLGADGQTMTIIPNQSACLHCLMLDGPPPPGTTPTCDSAGILSPIISVIAAYQASEGIKILSGNTASVSQSLTVFEMWDNRIRQLNIGQLREQVECPVCKMKKFHWLDGKKGSQSAVLCGRNAVQLSFQDRSNISLDELVEKLQGIGTLTQNPYLVRLAIDDFVITMFRDGRAIVNGTEDISQARTIYAKYIGS
jgi:molybdopterin-synthase adenylyltransferase